MRIWLDDVREMPAEGFDIWCKNSWEVVRQLLSRKVTHIDFDHDLGENSKSGYWIAELVEIMAANGKIPAITWNVHSSNPEGRKYIEMAMTSAERFWKNS